MVARFSSVKRLLIIANSGRMLAQSAQRSGYSCLVIDCFGDCDTRKLSLGLQVVEDLSIDCLQLAIKKLLGQFTFDQIIIGSGFETNLESLAWLESKFTLLANTSDTVNAIRSSYVFCETLKALNIDFPETRFDPPQTDFDQWLIKPYLSEGGLGIKFYQGRTEANSYWQRYYQGQIYSALFVSNGKAARLLGCNRQWQTEHQGDQVFVFSGVMRCDDKHLQKHQLRLCLWLNQLTSIYQLVGLNGIDFIIEDQQCWLLEINPRPPASLALYDQEMALAEVHINACNGELPGEIVTVSTEVVAYQIIYAHVAMIIPPDFIWPDWVSDQPQSGINIDTDQAICSIIASALNADLVLQALQHKSQTLYQLLYNKGAFSTCYIQPALINYPNP